MTVRRATKKKVAKKATKKAPPKKAPPKMASIRQTRGSGRGQLALDHDPRDFLRGIIDEVIFNDGSLEEADLKVAEHFKGRGDREREQMGKQMLPLLSRLVSAAPSLSTMVSSRAQ